MTGQPLATPEERARELVAEYIRDNPFAEIRIGNPDDFYARLAAWGSQLQAEARLALVKALSNKSRVGIRANLLDPIQAIAWEDGWQLAHENAACGHPRANWKCDAWPEKEIPIRCVMCEELATSRLKEAEWWYKELPEDYQGLDGYCERLAALTAAVHPVTK